MDIISQLQEQVNTIAYLAFNMFGTLQRDATPVRLSQNYPEPPPVPANPTEETKPNTTEQPKEMSAGLVKAAKQAFVPTSVAKNFSPIGSCCSVYWSSDKRWHISL